MSTRNKIEWGGPLLEMALSRLTQNQLDAAANPDWVDNGPRTNVTDLLKFENGFINVNPGSNIELGTGECTIFEAQAAVNAAFDLALGDTFVVASPGYYRLEINERKARTSQAYQFRKEENGHWVCARWFNGGPDRIKFNPEDEEYEDNQDKFDAKYDWYDLVLRGANIIIRTEELAPDLYNYYASLMTLSPKDARARIDEHKRNAIMARKTWKAAMKAEVPPLEQYTVDNMPVSADELEDSGRLMVTGNGCTFTAGTKNLSYLSFLVGKGFTLSSLPVVTG